MTDSADDDRSFLHAGSGFRTPRERPRDDSDEDYCPAFGYLRGVRERALALELRQRNGNREWFSYALLSNWRFDPSTGLLLRFVSDGTTLVLIRGSNLDAPVGVGTTNLTDRGLARHRVTWVREMDPAELKNSTTSEPTIDRIEVIEIDSRDAERAYLAGTFSGFSNK